MGLVTALGSSDFERCSDGNLNWNIGYAASGEWTSYLLDVMTTGTYNLVLRTASVANQQVSVALDGTTVVSNATVPATGGWQNWSSTVIPNVSLTKGKRTLKITFATGEWNLDKFYLVPSTMNARSAEESSFESVAISETPKNIVKSIVQNPRGLELTTSGGTLALFTVSGRMVSQHEIAKGVQQLDLQNFAPGLYLAKFRGVDGVQMTQKIQIIR